jgi:hypothetical protein
MVLPALIVVTYQNDPFFHLVSPFSVCYFLNTELGSLYIKVTKYIVYVIYMHLN